MTISSVPQSTNLAQANKFLLSFERLPDMTFFCNKANIPGISVGEAIQTNPLIDAPIPGDKMVYEPLNISFLIDEQMRSWTSIMDWIKGYSYPENTDQYKNLGLQQKIQLSPKTQNQYSDAILTYYSNKNNPILQLKFSLVFPVSLSGIDFDTQQSATDVLTGTASFRFTNYTIERL